MSMSYDLYCRDCEVAAGLRTRLGFKGMTSLWNNRKMIVHCVRFADSSDGIIEVKWDSSFQECGEVLLTEFVEFIKEHSQHRVEARDEYGRFEEEVQHVGS